MYIYIIITDKEIDKCLYLCIKIKESRKIERMKPNIYPLLNEWMDERMQRIPDEGLS